MELNYMVTVTVVFLVIVISGSFCNGASLNRKRLTEILGYNPKNKWYDTEGEYGYMYDKRGTVNKRSRTSDLEKAYYGLEELLTELMQFERQQLEEAKKFDQLELRSYLGMILKRFYNLHKDDIDYEFSRDAIHPVKCKIVEPNIPLPDESRYTLEELLNEFMPHTQINPENYELELRKLLEMILKRFFVASQSGVYLDKKAITRVQCEGRK